MVHRRSILLSIYSGSILLAGCSRDDGNESDSQSPSTDQGTTSSPQAYSTDVNKGTDCAYGDISVHFDPTTPANTSSINASRSGILDNQYISGALTGARQEYNDRGLTEENESTRLHTTSGEELLDADEDIREKIGYADETYVEYKNVTYRMKYLVVEC